MRFLFLVVTDANPLAHFWWWVEIHLGISRGGPDPYYNFWSGFGSDVTELLVLVTAIQLLRHANCHTKGCWRIGHKVEGTPFRLCHHCHPDHPGNKRNVPIEVILSAHRDAKHRLERKAA